MLLNLIYTIIFVTYFVISAYVHVAISFVIFILAYPFDKNRKLQHLYSTFISKHYIWLSPGVRMIRKGAKNVDKKQPYVIVSNHQSMLDIVILYYVPTYFKWISKREVYKIPAVGQLLLLHGDVCIKRGDPKSAKKMMKGSSEWLKKGVSMMIFPEGTRSKTGRINKFKEGAFTLAKMNNVPILPVIIEGTASFAKGNKGGLDARHRFKMTILPPISAEEVANTDIKDMAVRVHDMMLEEHKNMVPELYKNIDAN
jgi:1-acyl-sn-glycerol-3-phosphate acyltransferase